MRPSRGKDPGQQSAVDETAQTGQAKATDADELTEQIEQARGDLGDTVEALAGKVDIKARAREKAAEVTRRLKSAAVEAGRRTAGRAGDVRAQTSRAVTPVGKRVTAAGSKVREVTPAPVQRAVATGTERAKRAWVPLAAVTALAAGVVVARRRRTSGHKGDL
ncbi:MAG TPA: DUF3618 domain-containing protein [Streptosporangiaceae bacterium]|nr:DUF3618 domain-containing protein [Streptosporangiaceae bacterium]